MGSLFQLLVLLGVHVASGLNKPAAFYDECVKWTNAMRAREGLPVMGRWTRGEACLDSMAAFDASKKKPQATSQSAEFKDCLVAPGALDAATERVTSMSCLGSLDDVDSIRKCLTSYWMYDSVCVCVRLSLLCGAMQCVVWGCSGSGSGSGLCYGGVHT